MTISRGSTLLLVTVGVLAAARIAAAQTVGVSWSNFQEERWKRDEAAMKAAIEKAGGKYISADAQGSNEKQVANIEDLVTRGAKQCGRTAVDPGVRRQPGAWAVDRCSGGSARHEGT